MNTMIVCAMCGTELETWFDPDECGPQDMRVVVEPCTHCENERVGDDDDNIVDAGEPEDFCTLHERVSNLERQVISILGTLAGTTGQAAPSGSSVAGRKEAVSSRLPYTGQGSRLPQGVNNME